MRAGWEPVWSRHIRLPGATSPPLAECNLDAETFCYARVKDIGGGKVEVTDLFPVMIARELYQLSPGALISEHLRPAPSPNKLSPADRVFGWANAERGKDKVKDGGSYRGNLRIGQVTCQTANALANFGGDAIPLAILGQPKPAQGRFYIAQDGTGKPLEDGAAKVEAYQSGRSLRGRKVYPYQSLPEGYWENPTKDDNQEYRSPTSATQRSSQNRSMRDWVRPNVTFSFDLHVSNLSDVELGALLWLLSLPDAHYHKIGGGKPLGFGSVRLNIAAVTLRTGQEWKENFYNALDSDEPPLIAADACPTVVQCIETFKSAVKAAYPNANLLEAFRKAAAGLGDKPTHYPRTRWNDQPGPVPPNPAGESFKWFGENEAQGRAARSLPSITADDASLPCYSERRR